MFSKVLSAFVRGMEVCFINVEADVSDGMPVFDMVGFLSSEVKEASQRVRTGIRNSNIKLPPKHITLNLSPANIRKCGTCFDLAIALAVLSAIELFPVKFVENVLVLGELSLDGGINPVRGILPILIEAKKRGVKSCILPVENAREAALVEDIDLYGVSNLSEIISSYRENKLPDKLHIDVAKQSIESADNMYDFSRIAGQETAKRAAMIAAAGFHNLLLIGAPGAGKTMLARSISGIMPKMTMEESMEVTKIYSIAGLLEKESPLITLRPFRSPHHTASASAIAGGGRIPRPGEITLAHKGVLFLDELPEYNKNTLEVLRQPLEEGKIHISRVNATYDYPADFLLIAAMNPCKCGYFPDYNKCTCTSGQVKSYLSAISRPLLDRIDLCTEMQTVSFNELQCEDSENNTSIIRGKVEVARQLQKERYSDMGIQFNSQLTRENIQDVCVIGEEQKQFISKIYDKYNLTARNYHRILKVARTIADLEESRDISVAHLAEAVSYRTIDRKYWSR